MRVTYVLQRARARAQVTSLVSRYTYIFSRKKINNNNDVTNKDDGNDDGNDSDDNSDTACYTYL